MVVTVVLGWVRPGLAQYNAEAGLYGGPAGARWGGVGEGLGLAGGEPVVAPSVLPSAEEWRGSNRVSGEARAQPALVPAHLLYSPTRGDQDRSGGALKARPHPNYPLLP